MGVSSEETASVDSVEQNSQKLLGQLFGDSKIISSIAKVLIVSRRPTRLIVALGKHCEQVINLVWCLAEQVCCLGGLERRLRLLESSLE